MNDQQDIHRFGVPDLLGMSEEDLVGALRSFMASGDLVSARAILLDVSHPELAAIFWDQFDEKTHWVRHREGWCTHGFEQGVCLAYYEPGTNGLYPQCHTTALLEIEQAHALLVELGYESSQYARDLRERLDARSPERVTA